MRDRWRGAARAAPVVAAGLIGGLFFTWISGLRVLTPTDIDWAMKLDWQYHFLGWHFFRSEPWQLPPGMIERYYAPIGTAIGYTDSVPLVALLLKPFAAVLPMPLQYLGPWLLVCFVLQGAMGALITGLWTRSVPVQIAGGTLFVLVPTLLGRVGHPALASHWLLLWALWMYLRESSKPVSWRVHGTLGLLAGLIHPYLSAMALMILGALAVRRVLERGESPLVSRVLRAGGPLAATVAGLLIGWWCAGLLSVSGSADLASTGLDQYSMNLLGPVAPNKWSRFLPERQLANELQGFEGFQYLGAGLLALSAAALVLAVWRPDGKWRAVAPLVAAVLLSAIYSLSPRVTFGSEVVLDVTSPSLERLALFRATGRFFWPATYALVAAIIAVVVLRFRPRVALLVLGAGIALQVADLRAHYQILRETSWSETFHAWPQPMQAPAWHVVLPHYQRMVLYGPEQCGPAPVPLANPALLAGIYGLSINTGHMARFDHAARRAYCQQLRREYDAGLVADDAVYLLNRDLLDGFRARAQRPVVCATLDSIPTCVTAASYQAWKDAVAFQ
jgi:hypothetical protein